MMWCWRCGRRMEKGADPCPACGAGTEPHKLLLALRASFEGNEGAIMRDDWDDAEKAFDMDAAFREHILDQMMAGDFGGGVDETQTRAYDFCVEPAGDEMVCRFRPSGRDELLALLIDDGRYRSPGCLLLDAQPEDTFPRPDHANTKTGLFGRVRTLPHTASLYRLGLCDPDGGNVTFGEDVGEQELMERAGRGSLALVPLLIAIQRF